MEAILIFIMNAVLNGTLSHYLSKGLNKIDPGLVKLIRAGAKPEELKRYIDDHGLEKQVENFAASTIKDSVILPDLSKSKATLDDRAGLFGAILQLGFSVSAERGFDVLLSGSFLGSEYFSALVNNSTGRPTISLDGPEVIIKSHSAIDSKIYIFPVPQGESAAVLKSYHDALLLHRSTKHGKYFTLPREIQGRMDGCEVERVTAGAVFFQFPYSMNEEVRSALKIVDNSYAPVGDFYASIQDMIRDVSELLNIDVLDPEEAERIQDIYKQVGDIVKSASEPR